MFKYMLLVLLIFFVGCNEQEPPTFDYDNKKQIMTFHVNDEMFNVKLYNPFYQDRVDSCTRDSYTIYSQDSYFGRIGIENVDLDIECGWRGLDQSLYEGFIKKDLKLENFYALERIKVKNYEFVTYSVNDEYVLNMIYIYNVTKSTFILDYKGTLFDVLIKKLKPDFIDKYNNHPRYESVLNNSIVKDNQMNAYFGRQN